MADRDHTTLAPDAITAHQVRQEALRRAEHDNPHDHVVEGMMACVSAQMTAEAQARLEQAARPQSAARPAHPRPYHWHGPFGLPWF